MPPHDAHGDAEGRPDESRSRVSRRAFLKAGGGGALSGAVAATVLFEQSTAYAQQRWDHEADVVVAGSGAAAFAAALFAHEAKASVMMLEKAPLVGGTTAKSGGTFWIPNNAQMRQTGVADPREDLLRLLARISYPTLYNPTDTVRYGMPEDVHQLHATFYDQGSVTTDALVAMGLQVGFGGLPDYFAHLPENKVSRGRGITPVAVNGASGGASLIRQLRSFAEQRKIPILLDHRVARLVVSAGGEVVGVEATTNGKTVAVRARKGVVFGTGGFTANPEMALNYLRGPVFGGCAVPTNEGDLVTMATAVRAKLANMNNAWWGGVIVEQALQTRSVPTCIWQTPGDSVILVNADGRRCVNEKIQYNERTQIHFVWDPVRSRYPNQILFMIYDQSCRERFGGGSAEIVRPGVTAPYVLQANTLDELAIAIEGRLERLANRTGNFRLDPAFAANLKDTAARFNEFAATGKDLDFHRGEKPIELAFHGAARGNTSPNITMKPLAQTGPYYAVLVGAGTLDTKGGPKINARAEIVDTDEKPIPGLYGAGNCIASPAGQAYWAAGATLGCALVFGAIAGKNAAVAPVKQAEALRTTAQR